MKHCQQCAKYFDSPDWTCPVCGYQPPLQNGFPAHGGDTETIAGGFDPKQFHDLATTEDDSFWFNARNRIIIAALKRHFPDMENYMEIGCGTGYVLAAVADAFPGVRLSGTEFFSTGLDYARQRVAKAQLLQLDARNLPYIEEFDVIGAFDVLEHIVEDDLVLGQLHKALHPGGGIALTVPQHPWLWSSQDEKAHHVRRYGVGELRKKVEQAGFTIEYETSFVTLLFPFMVLARKIGSKSAREGDAVDELRLPALLNVPFGFVMALERLLLRFGIRFSFGGSGLLVARKTI